MRIEIGTRLKEERERLGLTQPEFAALGGASKRSQIEWEKGGQVPNAAFLAAVDMHGVDVQYVVTGRCTVSIEQLEDEVHRMSEAWETLEVALVHFKRNLPPSKQRIAAEALYRLSKEHEGVSQGQLMEYAREMLDMAA